MPRYTEMNLQMTEEQTALKKSIHKFCKGVLRPASVELDKIADPEDVRDTSPVLPVADRGAEASRYPRTRTSKHRAPDVRDRRDSEGALSGLEYYRGKSPFSATTLVLCHKAGPAKSAPEDSLCQSKGRKSSLEISGPFPGRLRDILRS